MARKARKFRFHHAADITVGAELQLDKTASHHLLSVLRANPGDQLELFNGDGFNYAAVLNKSAAGASKIATITVASQSPNNAESPLTITLVQAVSRSERMDQTIRQAVELGVKEIVPIYSRHAQKPGDEKRATRKHSHWHKIMISAAEQSGRALVPKLHPALPLSDWIEDKETGLASAPSLVLHPAADKTFSTLVDVQQLSIAIGPESGFDTDEVEAMIKAGATAVRMGPRTLRTETAGPAAIAILQAVHGDGSN